jgi:hypothetical protein
MILTKEQEKEWNDWLQERPKEVREVAEKLVPWKKYVLKCDLEDDIGNRYNPVSYDEQKDGRITVTCEKTNYNMPFGGYNVFGMDPNEFVECSD